MNRKRVDNEKIINHNLNLIRNCPLQIKRVYFKSVHFGPSDVRSRNINSNSATWVREDGQRCGPEPLPPTLNLMK